MPRPPTANHQRPSSGANDKLSDSDLTDSDLTCRSDLLYHDLAGADLTRAKLPHAIDFDSVLKGIDEAARSAGKYYLALLGSCAYVILTIGTLKDSTIIGSSTTMKLPIIGTEVSVQGFFVGAPIVILCTYIYFHVELLGIWERIGRLPAILPDGRRLSEYLLPWLPLSYSERHFTILLPRLDSLDVLKQWIVIALLWWLPPAAILFTLLRYARTREMQILHLQLAAFSIALVFGVLSYNMAKATLSRTNPRQVSLPLGVSMLLAASIGVYFCTIWISASVLTQPSYESDEARSKPLIVHGIEKLLVIDIRNQELSTRPNFWAGRDEDYSVVRGPVLEDRDLSYMQAYRAFAAGTSFSHSRIVGGNFVSSDLSRATFEFSNLQSAFFDGAKMTKSFLRRANLRWASLQGANLKGANLRGARLHFSNFRGALLNDADISYVDGLDADFSGADLRGVRMRNGLLYGCKFRGADLRDVTLNGGLDGIDISGAKLEGTRFGRFSLTRNIVACDVDFRSAPSLFEDFAYFPESDFARSIFKGMRLLDVDLRYGRFDSCDMRDVELVRSSIEGSQFFGTNLSGAILSDTYLVESVFVGAKLIATDLQRADLTGTTFSMSDMRRADLRSAKCDTIFLRCDLRGADLRGTGLTVRNFRQCNLLGAKLDK